LDTALELDQFDLQIHGRREVGLLLLESPELGNLSRLGSLRRHGRRLRHREILHHGWQQPR
jgi:hypothetical protein